MDDFLAVVGAQAMKYAIRSGIALTSTYALGQFSRLLKSVEDESQYVVLRKLQKLLDSKIRVSGRLWSGLFRGLIILTGHLTGH